MPEIQSPTVLIVDDEPFNVDIIFEYLDEGGYNLESAGDGLEAWTMLEADPGHFDVIVLDRMMPNMDGMEVLRRIKGHPVLKNRPVIMQTALAAREEILEGMQAGAYYYLTKPFDEEMLLSVIATAVEDRLRYKEVIEQSNIADRTICLMTEGHFQFKTLDSARDLARVLSNACPEPERVVIGLLELLLNAVEHGNLGITYDEKSRLREGDEWEDEIDRRLADPANKDKSVGVSFRSEAEGVRLVIRDQGDGFDWKSYLDMDPSRVFDSHGRGIAMSRMLSFDRIEYHGCGNEVEVFAAKRSD